MQKLTPSTRPDNIAAIATAHGRGGIGVVRISGSSLDNLLLQVVGRKLLPRVATLTDFIDSDGVAIDQGIAIHFPAPNSYTGEDVIELQGHGGLAVLQLVLQRCLELGARLAQPGEFTERAYLNDKIDLAQAESVADLIDATTSQAARSAMRSLQGEFSSYIHQLLAQLIDLRMLVEAMLDFPEEELDTPDILKRTEKLNNIILALNKTLNAAQQGSLLREGAHVVLVGQPNVGKSSLLNCLSGEDVALVSDIPGTTRDVIRQLIQIKGIPLHIVDTAGLRETQDKIESMGIERTRAAAERADVILLMFDARNHVNEANEKILESLPDNISKLYIYNKADLLEEQRTSRTQDDETHVYISAKTGLGVESLREKILSMIGWHNDAGVFMARERHIRALLSAQQHLALAQAQIVRAELFAEELRLAQEDLNTITGEFSSDDLLGEIFSRFCIGK